MELSPYRTYIGIVIGKFQMRCVLYRCTYGSFLKRRLNNIIKITNRYIVNQNNYDYYALFVIILTEHIHLQTDIEEL